MSKIIRREYNETEERARYEALQSHTAALAAAIRVRVMLRGEWVEGVMHENGHDVVTSSATVFVPPGMAQLEIEVVS